jgi:hypothetical protein
MKTKSYDQIATEYRKVEGVITPVTDLLSKNPIPKEKGYNLLMAKAKVLDGLLNTAVANKNAEEKAAQEKQAKELLALWSSISSSSNSENYGSSYSGGSSTNYSSSKSKGSCNSCKGTGECQRCNVKVKKNYLDDRCATKSKEDMNPGNILCSQCYGYGYEREMASKCDCPNGIGYCPGKTCYACKGSGWQKCNSCNGKGICNSCKGKGK